MKSTIDVSIIIPAYNGGKLLLKTLEAVFNQRTNKSYEVVIVDSGSSREELDAVRAYPVELIVIPNREFNHGLTRDLGASKSKGEFLLFINQDAEPTHDRWLDLMVQPMIVNQAVAATQGRIKERKDIRRFYWGTGSKKFYFTTESVGWARRYQGIGFSTVNCAIRRSVWEKNPFGKMDIMEDKDFQRRIHLTKDSIVYAEGYVYHSHDYTYQQLRKRCQDEGYGWRLVGERYSRQQAIRDYFVVRNYLLLLFGLLTFQLRSLPEFLYPFVRPYWVYVGNNFNQDLSS